jgi:hypothetical protein
MNDFEDIVVSGAKGAAFGYVFGAIVEDLWDGGWAGKLMASLLVFILVGGCAWFMLLGFLPGDNYSEEPEDEARVARVARDRAISPMYTKMFWHGTADEEAVAGEWINRSYDTPEEEAQRTEKGVNNWRVPGSSKQWSFDLHRWVIPTSAPAKVPGELRLSWDAAQAELDEMYQAEMRKNRQLHEHAR